MRPENDRIVSQQLEKNVEKYYDDNTKLFLKLGVSGSSQVIHQPLYISKGYSTQQALHAQHDLLLDVLGEMGAGPLAVLDLGCGIGSSMHYMAGQTDPQVTFTGVTLSRKQYARGLQLTSQLGLTDRVRLIRGSFQQLPADIGDFDLVYGIESFLHSPDASRFAHQVKRVLKPGGQFVLIDDFLTRSPASRREARILLDLQVYYQALSLFRPEVLRSMMESNGFADFKMTDYTYALRPSAVRNALVRMLVPTARLMARSISYGAFLIGGDARQRALSRGLLQYCMVRWRWV